MMALTPVPPNEKVGLLTLPSPIAHAECMVIGPVTAPAVVVDGAQTTGPAQIRSVPPDTDAEPIETSTASP